jgi:beta-lactamase regulating signal transducer with metallopeptidase domain
MSSMPLLSSPLAHAIGWALLHLLWQGVVVAGILAAALALLSKQSARTRYAVSCSALALLLVLGVATAWRAYDPLEAQVAGSGDVAAQPVSLAEVPKLILAAAASDTWHEQAATLVRSAQTSLPFVVLLWLTGVVFLSSRLTLGWLQTQRIARRNAVPASLNWQRTAVVLADALQLRRAVTLLESTAVEVPSVIGWLRPVVLLPASTLTGLTPEQIEMVLAHELAHIRRHDFFVNLLQAFVETLMFYHPAVWWMSSRVRIEREHCCDDLAVAVCGNPIQYARALTRLEELRASAPATAVAANGGSLFDRIRRIAGTRDEGTASTSRWAAAIVVLSILGLSLTIPAIPALAQREDAPKPVAKPATASVEVIEPMVRAHALAELDATGDLDDLDMDIVMDGYEMPEPPEAPEPPDMADFDFDFAFDAPDVPGIPAPPSPPGVPMAPGIAPRAPRGVPVPMAALAPDPPMAMMWAAMADENDRDDRDDDHERADGSLSVDDLVRLRNHGVTPEYIQQMRSVFPDTSLARLAEARAIGVTPEYVQSLRAAGVKVETAREAVRYRAMDVSPEFIKSIRAAYPNASANDIVTAKSMDITNEYVQSLRGAGLDVQSLRDAVQLKAIGVTPEYIRVMRAAYPNAAVKEISQARAVGVTAEYAKAIREAGIAIDSLRVAVQLRSTGVEADYIRELRAAGVDVKEAREISQLSAMGVRADFIRRLAQAGYNNLSVRELVRLAAAGVDDDFIRDMEKYRTKVKDKDKSDKKN